MDERGEILYRKIFELVNSAGSKEELRDVRDSCAALRAMRLRFEDLPYGLTACRGPLEVVDEALSKDRLWLLVAKTRAKRTLQ